MREGKVQKAFVQVGVNWKWLVAVIAYFSGPKSPCQHVDTKIEATFYILHTLVHVKPQLHQHCYAVCLSLNTSEKHSFGIEQFHQQYAAQLDI